MTYGDAYDEALRRIAALEDLVRDMYEGMKMDDKVFQAFARNIPGAYEIMRDPCLCEYRRADEFEPRIKELGIEVDA